VIDYLVAFVRDSPWQLRVTGAIILALALSFLLFFVIPAFRLVFKLARIVKALHTKNSWSVADLRILFRVDATLSHLWNEFYETLHEQKEERKGQTVSLWRATVPAESYFNAHTLIDTRLHTEFFKHFPGIFTGLGIIGTFTGLMQGLQAFDVSEDPGKVRESLQFLLHGVSEAFVVSAAAITIAMAVTLVEKGLLASLYRHVHRLAERLDGIFATGAGEEYLSRLVAASEEAASQSKILKDALVGDLKDILQDLTERQINASHAATQALGQQIREGINTGLQDPLRKLGGLVETAAGDQSKAATQLLQDVMVSFSQRLNELFGGQINGISELNQRTAHAMQEAVAALHQLVGNLESTSKRSGEAMTDSMVRAMQEMDARQAAVNDQTRALVEQLRLQVASSHAETHDKLRDIVADLGTRMGDMIAALQTQSHTAFAEQEKREGALVARTDGVVTALSQTVSAVVSQLAESTVQMRQSVTAMERSTSVSVDRLSESAGTLERGAVAFAAAGERVTTVMERAAGVAVKMSEASGALVTSSSALQSALADYRTNREAMSSVLSDIRAVVESAKHEASLTEGTLARIRTAAEILSHAQQEAETYLARVSGVLEETHATFAESMNRTLERANTDFHKQLSSAVGLLHSSIAELDVTLSEIQVKR
jgi:hypothetical protein